KEKLDRRSVLVTGKENEPLGRSGSHAGDCPVKHFAAELRHQHVAKDNVESALHDLAQSLNAAWDGNYVIMPGGKVIAQHFSKILAILQKQNPLGASRHMRWNVNVHRDCFRGMERILETAHKPKAKEQDKYRRTGRA